MTPAIRACLIGLMAGGLVLCHRGSQDHMHDRGTLTGKLVRSDGFIPSLPVRLCSVDRVVQTTSDKHGAFTFLDVLQGTYDLVAVGRLWKTVTIKQVEVKADKATQVTVDMNAFQESSCSRDTSTWCQAASYAVEYGPATPRKMAKIAGQIIDNDSKGSKALANASINIFRAGETNQSHALVSDKHGHFQLSLQPGTYRLTMTHRGFQDVKIPDFLVPLENDTNITINTRRPGAIVLCQ